MRYVFHQTIAVFTGLLLLNLYTFYCFRNGLWPTIPNRLNVLSGLAVGQLCFIAVWVATRPERDSFTLVVPAVGLLMSSYLRLEVGFFRDFTMLDYACRNSVQSLVPFVLLWPLVRSPPWQRLTHNPVPRSLQFSIGSILAWTACVAILGILLRQATWNDGQPIAVTRWLGLLAPGLLAVTVFFLHLLPVHCYLRLLLQVLCGGIVGYYLGVIGGNQFLANVLRPEFATQAAVVGIGLEWAGATAFHKPVDE